MNKLSEKAIDIFNKAVKRVKPAHLIEERVFFKDGVLTLEGEEYHLSQFKKIYAIGFGKASAYMAFALEEKLSGYIDEGAVVVKYGHSSSCRKIAVHEAGHPVPDQNGLDFSKRIIDIAKKATADDLVICFISGGGSALFESLPKKIMLDDLIELNKLLLQSGANINEMNTVRRHISEVKGGQLMRLIYPAKCASLIISDVPGDELESIASGPTALDDTTFQNAGEIIDKYNLSGKIPPSVLVHLQSGTEGKISETVKSDDIILENVQNIILGNIDLAIDAASSAAKQSGFEVIRDFDPLEGEAGKTGERIAQVMAKYKENTDCEKPLCLIFGGETTVTMHKGGKGGRNQELALSALIQLADFKGSFALLSAGTDGTDGPTDATGAVISNDTIDTTQRLQLEPEAFLQQHDSYHFFEKTGDLLKTGPTGTNVNDLVIVLIK